MISRLTGKLIEKNPPQVVIDVNGVGYEADVSMQTFYNLPSVGETVHLYTQLVVREDAHLLFGFASAEERAANWSKSAASVPKLHWAFCRP